METMIINHWAVVLCAASNLALGALWYSPALFYAAWKRENKLRDADFSKVKMGKLYTINFIISLVISYNMAFFLGDATTDWAWGLTAGFLTGFGWSAMIFAAIGLFELKTWKYIAINSGYIIINFSLIGFIPGIWR